MCGTRRRGFRNERRYPEEGATGQPNDAEVQDVFVASFSVFENKETDELTSYCVWPKGIESLLPKTDVVAFIASENDGPVKASWNRLADVVGHLLEEAGRRRQVTLDDSPSNSEPGLLLMSLLRTPTPVLPGTLD